MFQLSECQFQYEISNKQLQLKFEMGSEDEVLFVPHHVKIMKVALALVIIRQKPGGVSARDYTERLALQFNDKQDNWKERATVLQRELLRTRQELLNCQMAVGETHPLHQQLNTVPSHSCNTQPHPTHIMQLQEALYQSSQESGYCSSLPRLPQGQSRRPGYRGGMNTATNDDKERCFTERISISNGTGYSLTNNESSPIVGACELNTRREGHDTVGENLQKRIKMHVQFCSSVSALIHSQHQLSNLMTSDLRVTLRDTILDACEGFTEAVRNSDSLFPVPQGLLDEAAKCIVDSIQMPLMSPFRESLINGSVMLMSAMIERTMRQRTVTEEFSQSIHSLFLVLCGVPRLLEHAVVTMTTCVVSCAQTLKQGLEDCRFLDPDVINNTGALLGVLDSLLQTYEVSAVLTDDVRHKVIEDLETPLVELSESFPLFTYAAWRIIAQLSCVPS